MGHIKAYLGVSFNFRFKKKKRDFYEEIDSLVVKNRRLGLQSCLKAAGLNNAHFLAYEIPCFGIYVQYIYVFSYSFFNVFTSWLLFLFLVFSSSVMHSPNATFWVNKEIIYLSTKSLFKTVNYTHLFFIRSLSHAAYEQRKSFHNRAQPTVVSHTQERNT